tara:strand:+ start:203 stop:307 length:105 start_codon:yes stop_codon:yes gene_type:complete
MYLANIGAKFTTIETIAEKIAIEKKEHFIRLFSE